MFSILARRGDAAAACAVLMGLGFLVGAAGHLYKSPAMVAVGIGLIFLAVLLLPLGIEVAGAERPPGRPPARSAPRGRPSGYGVLVAACA